MLVPNLSGSVATTQRAQTMLPALSLEAIVKKLSVYVPLSALASVLWICTACDGVQDLPDLEGESGASEVIDCPSMCTWAPGASKAESDCTVETLIDLDYNLLTAPYACAAISESVAGCTGCMSDLGVAAEDCVIVYDDCLAP